MPGIQSGVSGVKDLLETGREACPTMRTSTAIWITLGIGTAYLGWVWLARHNGDLRMARTLQARNDPARSVGHRDSGTAVRITQFYALTGEMTDADRNTIC